MARVHPFKGKGTKLTLMFEAGSGPEDRVWSAEKVEQQFRRGIITDVQQPRYGQQALDILLPF